VLGVPANVSAEVETAPRPSLVRRLAPWVVGLAIVALILTRVPFDAFRNAIGHGPHLLLAGINVLIVTTVLCTDSISTWVGLIALRMRRPLATVAAVRGATYVLFLLNYAVGQGGFGYYLHRSGESALRAVGATLFLIGTNLATLLVVTTAAWAIHGTGEANAAMWWTLVAGCAAFLVYLAVIAMSPGILARRQILQPLFDAGIRGHALAMVGRLPHIAVIVLGHWLAMVAWGIDVPFSAGMMIMPAVVIASVLPISPAGLGTTQAAFVFFFRDYAAGATTDDRAATVLAFAVVHFVYGVLVSLLVGLACTPFARRITAATVATKPAAAREAATT
jgi:hypothetical protein